MISLLITFAHAKMLEETETKETIGFVVIIFIIGCISIGEERGGLPAPLATFM